MGVVGGWLSGVWVWMSVSGGCGCKEGMSG